SGAFNLFGGALVAKGAFSLDVGQVSGADAGTGAAVSFSDADAVSLTLTNVTLFAGIGGSLNAHGTPSDYSDDTVVNGTLGFGGAITGSLRVVAIDDGGATYLGIESDASALSAGLVGLGPLVELHARQATLKFN